MEVTDSNIVPLSVLEIPPRRSASITEKNQVDVAVSTGILADEKPLDAVDERLHDLKKLHRWDPNLPDSIIENANDALATADKDARAAIAHDLLDNSPYPEVRAAVSNIDEGGHSNTIRAWIIGLIFATIGAGLNIFFSLRAPSISIPVYIAQLLAYPIGKACAKWVPSKEFHFFGIKCNLNPGAFSKKEHCLIVIMANTSFGTAYATDIILAQRVFYGQRFGWVFEILLCISNQMLGFGFAGLFTRFLVEPAAMIWPSLLINTTLFDALHDHSKPNTPTVSGWRIGRYRMFMWVMLGSFCWYWFPGYIAPFLSVIAWVTWIKPQSPVMNQLFGGTTGLSLIPLTFDWTQIAGYNGSPLMTPWFSIANTLFGVIFWFLIVTPAIHYSGLFYSQYLPISDSTSYDNTGRVYNVSKILTPGYTLDLEKYRSYSPIFLSTTFMLAYGLSFAGILSTFVHVGLFHGAELWYRIRHVGHDMEDVHSRLMARFKPVPFWWYASAILVMMGMSLAVVLAYETHLTWWAFFLAIFISVVALLPIGIISATTNSTPGLNVITEFIIGYMQPGRPMAMMIFKAYGYITMNQALSFVTDLKLGHYMKIPPRVTFQAQMVATLWTSIVQICVLNWALANIEDVCTPHQVNHFTCPNGRVYFTASIVWGTIGPSRIFSVGQMYSPMMFFWIVGLLFPIAVFMGARIFPQSPIRHIVAPLFLNGAATIPPATPLNYLSWGIIGFIFNKYIRGRYTGWWMTYNAVISAGLYIGLALATILIFFTLTMTKTDFPSWWGTTIGTDTMDSTGTAIQTVLPKGTKFGPPSW
ncbi:Sexual differentiation process protein isp4 [Penicillium tannophilum]|nr:Sexual differentiation process protein isp4 [Penicillium tannophilum]